jgi:hypothetical protein
MGLVFDWGGFGGEAARSGGANGAHHVSLGHRPRSARHPPSQAPKGRNNVCRPFRAPWQGGLVSCLEEGLWRRMSRVGFMRG